MKGRYHFLLRGSWQSKKCGKDLRIGVMDKSYLQEFSQRQEDPFESVILHEDSKIEFWRISVLQQWQLSPSLPVDCIEGQVIPIGAPFLMLQRFLVLLHSALFSGDFKRKKKEKRPRALIEFRDKSTEIKEGNFERSFMRYEAPSF